MNPLVPATLANATYAGRLNFPYPPLTTTGTYNISSNRIVLGESLTLPFGGLTLSFRVEVDPLYSQIVEQYFYGRLEQPIFIEVIGNFDSLDCLLDLKGQIYVPSEEIDVVVAVALVYCNNCSQICSAQAVGLSIHLAQPWNISLNGSYELSGDVTTVSVGGATSIQGIDVDVFTTLQSNADQLSLQNLELIIHLPTPINLDVHGRYSKATGIATFLGSFSFPIVNLTVGFTADVAMSRISSINFSGSLSSPFTLNVEGSYKLNAANLSYLILTGRIEIEKFLNLSLTTQLDLTSRMLSMYMFYASVAVPLETQVSARYDSIESDLVDLMGSITLTDDHSIMIDISVNISSSPLSIDAIKLSGVFPHPLDVISFKGIYNRQCSCATVSGEVVQDDFSLTLSSDLIFTKGQSASIDVLSVIIQFHRPLSLRLDGQYMYSNDSMNSAVLSVDGEFEIPYISLNAMVLALLEGMSSVDVLKFHFMGTFPPPLGLTVMGDFETESRQLLLSGSLTYTYASLNASTTYLFMDDMHNQSAMLSDVRLAGQLTTPFQIDIAGQYVFGTMTFTLGGTIVVNKYLELAVNLSLDTLPSPPILDTISLSGSLMTPIPFDVDFQGTYDSQTNSAMLSSQLSLGTVMLTAHASLIHLANNSFELNSIMISGYLDSPLAIEVTAIYTPSNDNKLILTGTMEIGSVSFIATAYAQAVNNNASLILNKVMFTGVIQSPFMITLEAVYMSGNILMLSSNLDFTDLSLSITSLVNLTMIPREISSITFEGHLHSPFSGNVTAVYTSGDLVLHGEIDLASLHFTVNVFFRTSPNIDVDRITFTTVFNPLNLMLIGTYNRTQKILGLSGIIHISTPSINLAVSGIIDLNQQMKSLSNLKLTADFNNPPLQLSGIYSMESRNIQLTGELPAGTLELMASAVVHLGNTMSLEEIKLMLNYTIPFGNRLFFILEAVYNTSANELFFLNGRITQGGSNIINALLVLSSKQTPSTRVVSLYIQEIDIGALLQDYLTISWPSNIFPIVFRNVAIYQSEASLTYNMITYKAGYHARGEVKFFFLPNFIIEASLITTPRKRFEVSATLTNVIDWSVIVLHNTDNQNYGPSVTIQYEPDTELQQFEISGGLEFFGVSIGNVHLKVMDMLTSATLVLSESLKDQFFGILPEEITLYWSEKGFYTNLQIPDLDIPDFSFDNVASPDICSKLGGILGELAIDVPFNLHGSLLVRLLENGSISFGAAIQGSAEIQIVDETVYTVRINILVIEIILAPGQTCSWQCFVDAIEKGIKNAGPMIIDQLLDDPEAVAAISSGKLGTRVVGETAEAICDEALRAAADAAAAAAASAAAGAATITGGVVSAFACLASKIFGGCNSGGGGGGDHDEINHIMEMLGQTCGDNSLCDQICMDDDGVIICSCMDGYYLASNRYTCRRKLSIYINW